MIKRCSPKCIFFPAYIYDKANHHWSIDENGVKHYNTKAYCDYDGHIITDWKNCKYYQEKWQNFVKYSSNDNKDKTIILMGKSAAGKDYVLNFLIQNFGFNPVISHTTRPPREKEVDGQDYYFINTKEFAQKLSQGEFIETREYSTCFNNKQDIWYYGITKDEFDYKNKKICVIDTTGQNEIVKYCGAENIITIYIDVDDTIREQRARLRGSFNQFEWDRRLADDNKKFKNIKYDYKLDNNGSIEKLQENIKTILKGEGLIG